MFSLQPGSSAPQPHREGTLPILETRKLRLRGSRGLPKVPRAVCGRPRPWLQPRLLHLVAPGPRWTAQRRQSEGTCAWGLDLGVGTASFPSDASHARTWAGPCRVEKRWPGEGRAQQPVSLAGSARTCILCAEPQTTEEAIPGAQGRRARDPQPDIGSALRAV